jgi:hypothetical protein
VWALEKERWVVENERGGCFFGDLLTFKLQSPSSAWLAEFFLEAGDNPTEGPILGPHNKQEKTQIMGASNAKNSTKKMYMRELRSSFVCHA